MDVIEEKKAEDVVDVSQLPPRSKVHTNKKEKKKGKRWHIITLRSMVVLFFLILIAIPLYYYWGDITNKIQDNDSFKFNNPLGEEIFFENR